MDMQNCTLCPRLCHVDRTKNYGVCHASDKVEIALVSLHQWEEPCLSGTNGAGTVFFSHCNMRCIFCQNHEISTEGKGFPVTIERLAQIFLEQQSRNAHCLELVTPTHYVLQIIEALKLAKKQGLSIPVVYNTSGYERVEVLEMLKDYIDVFLPDFKYYSPDTAKEFSHAPDYPQVVKEAIDKMFALVGKPQFKDNIMQKGVIIRHLILPGHGEDSMRLIDWIADTFSPGDVMVSLMRQFIPCGTAAQYPEINRKLTDEEYEEVELHFLESRIEDGFIQESPAADDKFIPAFDGTGILP